MTKIEIPKIIKPLRLAEYDAAFGDAVILVWCNPSREFIWQYIKLGDQVTALRKLLADGQPDLEEMDRAGNAFSEWFREIWSQGPEETRWTEEEIRALFAHSEDTDPQLWPWLTEKTVQMIKRHRAAVDPSTVMQ